jgi:hypothetical protein
MLERRRFWLVLECPRWTEDEDEDEEEDEDEVR